MGEVIEESGGVIGMSAAVQKSNTPMRGPSTGDAVGDVDEDMDAEGSEKGDDYAGEWDAYEQEV